MDHQLGFDEHGWAQVPRSGDFVGVIAGVTAIPKGEIRTVHLQATKTLVDIAEPVLNSSFCLHPFDQRHPV